MKGEALGMPRVHPKHKGGGKGGKQHSAADDHEAARLAKEKVSRLSLLLMAVQGLCTEHMHSYIHARSWQALPSQPRTASDTVSSHSSLLRTQCVH